MVKEVVAETEHVEKINPLPLKGVFTFSRTLDRGGWAKGELTIEFPINWEDSDEDIITKAHEAATEAKMVVYEQLGLDFTVDEGVAMEVIKDAFPGTTHVPAGAAAATAPVAANPPYAVDSQVPSEKDANQEWGRQRFAVAPNEFWDNRANKRNPRAPDLKHKSTELPVWRV